MSDPSSEPRGPIRLPATGALMPLVSLRRHWRIGLAVAVVVLVLGTVVAFIKGRPVYGVTAVIHVAPRFVNVLREPKDFDVTSYQQYRQFVEHQVRTVARYDIVLAALQSLGDHAKVWQQPGETERQAAERLMADIGVTAIKDTYLISAKLESGNPQYLDEILNAVINTYIAKIHQETLFYGRDARSSSLVERRTELQRTLEARSNRRTQISQELGATNLNEVSVNPFDSILMDSRTALAKAHRTTIEAEAQLAILLGKEGAKTSALDALVAETVAKDAGLASLKAGLNERRAKLVEQISGLEPAHPLTGRINRELEEIQDEEDRATEAISSTVADHLLTRQRAELSKSRQIETELQKQVDALQEGGTHYATLYQEALGLNADIERLRTQLEEVDNRLDFFQTESEAPGYVRMESPARPPLVPMHGGKKKLFIMACFGALALGLGTPLVIDLLDRRIRTAGQAAKVLGYPPTAAFFEPSQALDARRVDADRKRRLAITLDRERRERDARVVLMTGVKPGCGVTGLALELARELQELNCRTLVIETNPLKPDRRYLSPDHPGLLDVLNGFAPIEAAIVPAEGSLPDRIGIGFAGVSHMHNYGKLQSLMEPLKETYSLILLDAPSVLLSADSEYLVSIADVTLLLIGALQTLPNDVRRAIDILQKIDPRTIGFIVTRLEAFRGGGYYDKMIREYLESEEAARDVLKTHPLRQA